MEKIQALSGLAFGTFGILHLGGHVLANYSFKASDAFMYAAREIYQSPLFESMLGVSLLVHMGSSAWIYSKRQPPRKLKNETGSETMKLIQKEAQVNRYCGYTIAFFVFGHIFATRLGPILYLDDPSIIDLSYVTLSYQNLPYLMLPYYFLFSTCASFHFLYSSVKALSVFKIKPFVVKPGTWTRVFQGLMLVMLSTTLAICGFYERVEILRLEEFSQLSTKLFGF